MLKKDITFTDFDGNEVTETHYFNLTRTELIEMELEFEGGLEQGLRDLIASEDNALIFRKFKEVIIGSHGKREGNSFLKDEHQTKLFAGSPAFDELIVSFFTDVENAAEFIRGILPRDLEREVKDQGFLNAPESTMPLTPPAPPAE